MRRSSYWPHLFLGLFFLCLLSVSQRSAEKVRSVLICGLAPLWSAGNGLKMGALDFFRMPLPGTQSTVVSLSSEVERLKQENQIFQAQMENVRQWLLHEERIQEQVEKLRGIAFLQGQEAHWKAFFQRRGKVLADALELQLQALPAKVVYREPALWSSVIWLNVGEKHNRQLGKKVVAKDSPVLVGTCIVGVVEHVEEAKCKVRLITDARIAPSVRASRGQEQNRPLFETLEALLFSLEVRKDLFASPEEAALVTQKLQQLKTQLAQDLSDLFLAKGELFGTSHPLWRARGGMLKGVGFNYDFSDAEGGARDLRSGESLGASAATAILQVGDLLVTSGLDGVFPPGFRVAIVTKVAPLKEGASSYEIQARPTAGNLDELYDVSVLPPVIESLPNFNEGFIMGEMPNAP